MMTKVNNRVQLFLNDERNDRILNTAYDMFRDKSFLERYRQLNQVANYSRYLLPLFSIATGSFYLVSLLGVVTGNMIISIILSIMLLTLWEAGKISLLSNAFQSYYGRYKLGMLLFIVSVLLSAGSAYMSIEGAKEIYAKNDLSSQLLADHYQAKIDSIGSKISALEALKSKRWGGLLSHSENQMILNYQQNIQQLENIKQDRVGEALTSTSYNKYIIGVIAGIIEILIVLGGWFFIYYHYICFKEQEMHQVISEKKVKKQKQSIKETFSIQAPSSEELFNPSQIGFQPSLMKDAGDIYEEKAIKQAIEGGIKDFRTLMKMFKLNVNQTKKYLEKYSPS